MNKDNRQARRACDVCVAAGTQLVADRRRLHCTLRIVTSLTHPLRAPKMWELRLWVPETQLLQWGHGAAVRQLPNIASPGAVMAGGREARIAANCGATRGVTCEGGGKDCFLFFFFGVIFPFPENRKHLITMLILTSVLCFQLISCICFPPVSGPRAVLREAS